jgi:hypothetical protein
MVHDPWRISCPWVMDRTVGVRVGCLLTSYFLEEQWFGMGEGEEEDSVGEV